MSDGSGGVETVLSSDDQEWMGSFCRDGRYLAYSRSPKNPVNPSIWVLPLTGDRRPFPLVQAQFANFRPVFSPDCKWIAYNSNAPGRTEVYLTNFPDATRRHQVSAQGGGDAHWRGDGKELFYLSRKQGNIMAVDVEESGVEISLGNPRTLFHLGNISFISSSVLSRFEVTSDGRRFLIVTPNQPPRPVPLTVVTNFL